MYRASDIRSIDAYTHVLLGRLALEESDHVCRLTVHIGGPFAAGFCVCFLHST